jgi:glyoxylase-like metal-dependent hydrolase (beta-lactamase superfamily II)
MIEIRQMPLGPLQTNAYLLGCDVSMTAAIIDPSWNGRGIVAMADEAGYEITHILLTHTHFDHVAGLEDVKMLTDAPIYVHPEAVPMLSRAGMSAALFGIRIPQVPNPDETLTPGQKLTIGQLNVDVLYTPGHAPGHVSFHLPAYRVIFSGDVLFQGSIGRTDLEGGSLERLLQSIREQLLTLPDETRVFSGHGAATTIGDERANNPFLQDDAAQAL